MTLRAEKDINFINLVPRWCGKPSTMAVLEFFTNDLKVCHKCKTGQMKMKSS